MVFKGGGMHMFGYDQTLFAALSFSVAACFDVILRCSMHRCTDVPHHAARICDRLDHDLQQPHFSTIVRSNRTAMR